MTSLIPSYHYIKRIPVCAAYCSSKSPMMGIRFFPRYNIIESFMPLHWNILTWAAYHAMALLNIWEFFSSWSQLPVFVWGIQYAAYKVESPMLLPAYIYKVLSPIARLFSTAIVGVIVAGEPQLPHGYWIFPKDWRKSRRPCRIGGFHRSNSRWVGGRDLQIKFFATSDSMLLETNVSALFIERKTQKERGRQTPDVLHF